MNAPDPKSISIVVPAYNEERFIAQLVAKVLAVDLSSFGLTREVIVVDDGSRDRTAEIVEGIAGVTLLRMPKNGGKGAAVRAGIAACTGDLVMIQDADLEYEPDDYRPMIQELLSSGADAVYGSRYMVRSGNRTRAPKHEGQSWGAYLGGRSLSLVQWWFTGQFLTDTVTALKLFHAPVIRSLTLVTTGFELDHEITSKVLARGQRIREVPIRYYPRSREDGKKIGFRDWLKAVRTYAMHSGTWLGLAVSGTRLAVIAMLVVALALAGVLGRQRLSRWWSPPAPAAYSPPAPPGESYRVADNLYVIPGGGGNTSVFITARGVVVVDPKYPENGAAVVAEIRRLTDKPIVYVIDTHSHNDHFGGNTAVPMAAQIVVQEQTARNIARLRRTGDPSTFDGRHVVSFKDRLTLFDGPDAIDLYYSGAAHTNGDALVVFRASGVMAAGDVFPGKQAPVINLAWGGSAREYATTIGRAVTEIKGVTRVITGHGPVLEWTDFVDYGDFNQRLLMHVSSEMAAGHDWNQARRDLTLPERFAGYNLDRLIFTIQDMYKDLTPWWHFW